MPKDGRALGVSGEALAAEHLRGLGYRILGTDVRTPLGQLDLIAQDGDTLVFVEVKARGGVAFGLPQEGVGAHKIRKLQQLARYVLQRHPHPGPVRFDVIGLVVRGGRVLRLDHIKNAIDS
ncbi:MAG TPA: YraN family protein [Candidatus Limnocylindrales bacterium]|nr:YraN family protein [Candidatus Limnocylindrales bacterium]